MLKKMLAGVLLSMVGIGVGALAFERFAPPAWVAPLAAMDEHGEGGKRNKTARDITERDRKETRHDRRRDDH